MRVFVCMCMRGSPLEGSTTTCEEGMCVRRYVRRGAWVCVWGGGDMRGINYGLMKRVYVLEDAVRGCGESL